MYCIKMKRTDPEFWTSTFRKIIKMIDMYVDEKNMQNAAINEEIYESKYFNDRRKSETISSMKQIEGWDIG